MGGLKTLGYTRRHHWIFSQLLHMNGEKNSAQWMRQAIQKVATGPEYSKDLAYDEAYPALRAVFSGEADDVQAAVLLIALRMKRETADENAAGMQALYDLTAHQMVHVPRLVDVAEPYGGQIKNLPTGPFLPAVLAACGIPAYTHGMDTVSPKFGCTPRYILEAAGVQVDTTLADAATQIENPEIGWAYVDQKVFCPSLNGLIDLRNRIVKRNLITTIEVLSRPLQSTGSNHLVTGYVHVAYPPVYCQLARQVGYDSAVVIRGVEGGIQPSLRQPGRYFEYHDKGEETAVEISPEQVNIEAASRAVPVPEDLPPAEHAAGDRLAASVDLRAFARAAAQSGLDALAGKDCLARECLAFTGAIVLKHLNEVDSLEAGAQAIRQVLDSGKALKHFQAVLN